MHSQAPLPQAWAVATLPGTAFEEAELGRVTDPSSILENNLSV